MKAKLEAVEKEIKNKNLEIKDAVQKLEQSVKTLISMNQEPTLLPIVSNNSLPRSYSMSVTQSTSSTMSTITVIPSNIDTSTSSSLASDIPQLDGESHDITATVQNKCENCGKNFRSKEALQNHDDEHGWGCDDCYLCLTSKQSYDLHVLEHHPDSTNCIRDHIQDATKKLFTADQRHDG